MKFQREPFPASKRLACRQLWLWFWGMLITTIPWHFAGLMGEPRRVGIFDYSIPLVARTAPLVIVSVIGGLVLLIAATLLIIVLVRSHLGDQTHRVASLGVEKRAQAVPRAETAAQNHKTAKPGDRDQSGSLGRI